MILKTFWKIFLNTILIKYILNKNILYIFINYLIDSNAFINIWRNAILIIILEYWSSAKI